MENLKIELERNREILSRIKSYLHNGPAIDHLWTPAVINAEHLSSESWNSALNSGILTILEEEAIIFNLTYKWIQNTSRLIKENEANWYRLKEWHEHDIGMGNVPYTQRKLVIERFISEGNSSIDMASEYINKSIGLIERFEQRAI